MTKAQIKVLNELIKDPTFKGHDALEWLLWRNTTKPKYTAGNSFRVSASGQSVYGYAVKDFKATIKKAYCYKTEKQWYYELEAVCICGNKKHTATIFTAESKLGRKCSDNVNVLGDAESEYPDEMSI
jgi:hypothetical protein